MVPSPWARAWLAVSALLARRAKPGQTGGRMAMEVDEWRTALKNSIQPRIGKRILRE